MYDLVPDWDDCSCTRQSRSRAVAWAEVVAAPAAIDYSMIPKTRDVSSMASPRVRIRMVSLMYCTLDCNHCHCCCCLDGAEWYIRTMINSNDDKFIFLVVASVKEDEVVEIVDSDLEIASMSMAVEREAEAVAVAVALAEVETADG